MGSSVLFLFLCLLGTALAAEEDATLSYSADEPWCLLTQAEDDAVKKPFPSLLQCYKHNDKACCVAAHDAAIKESFHELMSESCLAQFPELADFYCAGCNPKQPLFTTTKNDGAGGRKLRVCQTYADTIWTPTGDAEVAEKYDHCGVNVGRDDDPQIPGRHTADPAWNQTAFLNMVRPPFFGDYEIEIVPDEDTRGCLSGAGQAAASALLLGAVAALSVFVLA